MELDMMGFKTRLQPLRKMKDLSRIQLSAAQAKCRQANGFYAIVKYHFH